MFFGPVPPASAQLLPKSAFCSEPGVMHPRDPCADLDPVTWLADLRNGDTGELLFSK